MRELIVLRRVANKPTRLNKHPKIAEKLCKKELISLIDPTFHIWKITNFGRGILREISNGNLDQDYLL